MSGPSIVRRWLWSLPLAASAVLGGVVIQADGPVGGAASKLRRKVERLLSELDAETRSVRTAARESLLALGPAILPLLPDERSVASAATRDAVGQIRTRLERQSALATLAASRVTLQGRFPLREILARISEQTGNQFDCEAIDPVILLRVFPIDDQSRSFWSACDDLIQKAGLAYVPVHKAGSLKLLPAAQARGYGELVVADRGPFRVAVASAALRPGWGESRHLLRIEWNLMVEPRLRPLFASIAAGRLVVIGSGSTVFKPTTPTAKWELSMGEGTHMLRLASDFEIPAGVEPASVEFRGSLGVEMAAGPQQIVFDDLSSTRRETRRTGNATVGLRSVEFSRTGEKHGAVRIEISLVYDKGGPAFESFRTWMYHNEATLVTKSGRRFTPRPIVSTRQQGDGSFAVEYNFADIEGTPRDYRFVYVAPTLITQVPVEFRFPKIPVAQAASEGTKP